MRRHDVLQRPRRVPGQLSHDPGTRFLRFLRAPRSTALEARSRKLQDLSSPRILAEKDPALLERWLEKAAVASSAIEVIDDPS